MSSMRFAVAVALVTAVISMPVHARKPAPAQAEPDFWISFGGGFYEGQDYDPPPGQPKTDAQKTGGSEAMLALNLGGPALVRLRAAWMFNYTSNTAEDVGVLFGLPLGPKRDVYLAAGLTRLTDVSARKQSPSVGVPLELLFYPTRGLEVAVHGNFNPDSDFVGITLAGVFGKRRAE